MLSESSDTSKQAVKRQKSAHRASRACETCRKQKTRCLPSFYGQSCLRCRTLSIDCSLVEEEDDGRAGVIGPDSIGSGQDNPLRNLEVSVSQILNILQSGAWQDPASLSPQQDELVEFSVGSPLASHKRTHSSMNGRSTRLSSSSLRAKRIALEERVKGPSFGRPSVSYNACPFNIFGTSLSDDNNMPLPISRLFDPQMVCHDRNIITMGIISEAEAVDLLSHFRENYNHWVSFPEDISTEELLDRILRRCSLLFTVCCCVSLRYSHSHIRIRCYAQLLERLLYELNQSMLVVPQTIEFMQALAVLSIYASSLSHESIVFDAWFYSGIALQHFVTKDVLGLVMSFDGISPVTEMDELRAYRVWNHLCLVHLVNCVLSGRMCILDDMRLDLCRRTLDLTSATNFDGRMIAEINLQQIVYNFTSSTESLESVEAKLSVWMDDWKYLFEQPIIQFVEAGYHYGYFMTLYYWNYLQVGNFDDDIDASPDAVSLSVKSTLSGLSMVHDGVIDTAKSTNGTSLPLLTPGEKALSLCNETMLIEMARHLDKVVESMLTFDSDAYFSYLSDQVHFYGAFCGLMLIRIIWLLQSVGRTQVLTKRDIKAFVAHVSQLESRFKSITTSPDDLPAKYSLSIDKLLADMKSLAKK